MPAAPRLRHHGSIEFRSSRQIIQTVRSARLRGPAGTNFSRENPPPGRGSLEVADAWRRTLPRRRIESLAAELITPSRRWARKFIIGIRTAGKTDDIGALGKPSFFEIVVQRGDEFAPGQVTRSAKDDNAGAFTGGHLRPSSLRAHRTGCAWLPGDGRHSCPSGD